MRTIDGILREVVIQVKAETAPGESVFISGNTQELGQWKVSKAIMLSKSVVDGNIWGGVISIPADQNVLYRYLTCMTVEHGGKTENVVRQWESHLRPRIIRPLDYVDGKCDLHIFGYQDDTESIASGWLTCETIVQLKMFNSSVTIWKRKYRDKQISMHVSTIDISRRESDILGIEDDSTLPDGANHSWPIVEVAQMNETGWQYSKQSQFGVIYCPGEYVMFQIQMLDPDTIDLLCKGCAVT